MSRTTIAKLIAAVVIVSAMLAPAASARYIDEPGNSASASQAYVPIVEPSGTDAASSGFDWGDAAVGAAGTLIVLSAGGVAVVTRRSRGRGHTLATG